MYLMILVAFNFANIYVCRSLINCATEKFPPWLKDFHKLQYLYVSYQTVRFYLAYMYNVCTGKLKAELGVKILMT